jgi:hypothetical protein
MTRDLQDDNKVGDAGACGLGEGLKTNSSLKTLSLVRKPFFVSAFFFESDRDLPWMTRTLQMNNDVGDAGAFGLAEGLKCNTSLKALFSASSIFFRFLFFFVCCCVVCERTLPRG